MTAVFLREALLYGLIWYGMVWYGMVWYGMVWLKIIIQFHHSILFHHFISFHFWEVPLFRWFWVQRFLYLFQKSMCISYINSYVYKTNFECSYLMCYVYVLINFRFVFFAIVYHTILFHVLVKTFVYPLAILAKGILPLRLTHHPPS